MKAKLTMYFNNGETFSANLKGNGINHIDNKCYAIINKLEKPGRREIKRWKVEYRASTPDREFITVNTRWHVSGAVYNETYGAPIIERFI